MTMKGVTEESQENVQTDSGDQPDTETLFQLKSLGALLKGSIESGELVQKRNWWSKKQNPPNSPREFGIDDTIGSFITWNKGKQCNGKTKRSRKMKTLMAKKEQKGDLKKKLELDDRSRMVSKFPHIFEKQNELEEFNKAETERIAKQDQALVEIDNLLAKLDREEPKSAKTFITNKSAAPFQSKDDIWSVDEDNTHNDKPITYHDSLTDSLDRLLEDIEEHMDDSF